MNDHEPFGETTHEESHGENRHIYWTKIDRTNFPWLEMSFYHVDLEYIFTPPEGVYELVDEYLGSYRPRGGKK